MPLHTPFTLGPFTVDAHGHLNPAAPGRFPTFSILWHGRTLSFRLAAQADEQAGSLGIRSVLGRVPSTAGAAQAHRGRAFAIVRQLARHLPTGWTMTLLADHRVALEAHADLRCPTTATALLTRVSLLLLELSPYLDVLDDAGIPGPAAPGMANT